MAEQKRHRDVPQGAFFGKPSANPAPAPNSAFFGYFTNQRLDIDGHQLVHSRIHLAARGERADIHPVPNAAIILCDLLNAGAKALEGDLAALALIVFLPAEGTGREEVVERGFGRPGGDFLYF